MIWSTRGCGWIQIRPHFYCAAGEAPDALRAEQSVPHGLRSRAPRAPHNSQFGFSTQTRPSTSIHEASSPSAVNLLTPDTASVGVLCICFDLPPSRRSRALTSRRTVWVHSRGDKPRRQGASKRIRAARLRREFADAAHSRDLLPGQAHVPLANSPKSLYSASAPPPPRLATKSLRRARVRGNPRRNPNDPQVSRAPALVRRRMRARRLGASSSRPRPPWPIRRCWPRSMASRSPMRTSPTR